MQTYDEYPFKAMLWNKSPLAFVAGGMLAAAKWHEPVSSMLSSSIGASIDAAFSDHAMLILYGICIMGGATMSLTLFNIFELWLTRFLTSDNADTLKRNLNFRYKLPEWPKAGDKLNFILGEKHKPSGEFVYYPEWFTLNEKGIFGNVAVFGGIGSGKTQGIMYPLVKQLIGFHAVDCDKKPSGLILDVKGNFVSKVQQLCQRYERTNDLIIIKPAGTYKWNPIHAPHMDSSVIAGRLLAIYDNLNPNSFSTGGQWVKDGVFKLLEHSIGLIRYANGYVTIKEVNHLLQRIGGEDSAEYSPVEAALKPFSSSIQTRKQANEYNDADNQQIEEHLQFFKKEWRYENSKNKSIYIGATTNITGLFSKPDIAATFCPKQEEIDFPGFDSLLEQGQIICLGMSDSEYGVLASAIGVLLKLEFQRSVLARPVRIMKQPDINKDRCLFFLADEYQNFVSAGNKSGAEGDDNFYALSRESRCFSIVSSQSPVTLISRIGKEKARVIMASLRTKLFFSMTDAEDMVMAADLCGKGWKQGKSFSYNESGAKSKWNWLSKNVTSKKPSVSKSENFSTTYRHLVDTSVFRQLSVFEMVVSAFDGIKQSSGRMPLRSGL